MSLNLFIFDVLAILEYDGSIENKISRRSIHPVLYIRNSTSQLESGFSYLLCHFSGSKYKKSIKIQTINWYGWAMFDLDGFWLYKSQVMKNPTIFLVFLLSCAAARLHCAAARLHCAAARLHCAAARLHCAAARLHCAAARLHCAVARKMCTENNCFSRWKSKIAI